MPSGYFAYIVSAYGLSALALLALGFWIWRDARHQRRRLAALEDAGLRRRAGRPAGPGEAAR